MKSVATWSAFLCLVLAFTASVTAASAQGSGPGSGQGGSVNDCTFLRDPVELRNCILKFEGSRTPPPVAIEAPPPAPAAPAEGGILDDGSGEAVPAGKRRNARAREHAKPAQHAPAPSRANDTPTSIEQVEIPPRAH